MKIHQIKIDFHVTEQISRFVYVYLLEADSLYLIDSGVFGCEKQIMDYLDSIGRNISDIKGIFLTHAHPDHIGSAAWFQEHTGCKIYASEGEKRWIEDIDLQFKERPIPNFYQLAGKSSKVDVVVKDGDKIDLEDYVSVSVIRTAGHLVGGLSDMSDGIIARKTNTVSEFGSKFDSAADFVFVTVCLIKILPAMDIPTWLYIWTAVITLIKFINIISGYVVQKKFVTAHTAMNKVTGAVLFMLPLTLTIVPLKYTGILICIIATFAAVQEGHFMRAGQGIKT